MEKSINDITNWDNLLNFRRCSCKKPWGDTIICQLFQGISYAIQRGKMDQILLAYSLPRETAVVIMILYKNMKVKVRSLDGYTNFFDIVACVLQVESSAPHQFIICVDYVLQMLIYFMKGNGFSLAKARSRKYPIQMITDGDYTDDIALLTNTPTQAESLLYSVEWASGGIGLYVKADKTESSCALIKEVTSPH